MYMPPTQIYLKDDDVDALERAAEATGASRSELIRRAIQQVYGEPSAQARLAALDATSGLWSDRATTGAEYTDAIRGDLAERLQRAGLA